MSLKRIADILGILAGVFVAITAAINVYVLIQNTRKIFKNGNQKT